MALFDLTENISKYVDEREIRVGVFIDFVKAFDTVNHAILIDKLYHGIRGLPHKWISSYLFNRKQYVSIDDVEFSQQYIPFGVPQGSILGPYYYP